MKRKGENKEVNMEKGNMEEEKMTGKNNGNPTAEEILQEQDQEKQKDLYNQYVENMKPKRNVLANCCKAFVVGGSICLLGEIFTHLYQYLGNDKELAGLYSMLTLIFLSVLLTGLNIYQKLGQFAGAGSLVPITGFANSVASPAVEAKVEGQVFGVGCQIFKISGPVILYGILSSWLLGLIYYFVK